MPRYVSHSGRLMATSARAVVEHDDVPSARLGRGLEGVDEKVAFLGAIPTVFGQVGVAIGRRWTPRPRRAAGHDGLGGLLATRIARRTRRFRRGECGSFQLPLTRTHAKNVLPRLQIPRSLTNRGVVDGRGLTSIGFPTRSWRLGGPMFFGILVRRRSHRADALIPRLKVMRGSNEI